MDLTFVLGLAEKYPVIVTILAVIGFLRVINKPLFSFLRVVVAATVTPKDDVLLDKVEASKAYKVAMYVLDWFGSVKLPAKK